MTLVKICGVKRPQDAQTALEHGANLIGIILVPGRGRTVDVETARAIADVVHSYSRPPLPSSQTFTSENEWQSRAQILAHKTHARPMLVGVVQNQPLEEVQWLQQEIGLDIVQFHGDEPLEWCQRIQVPTFKRFTPGTALFSSALDLDAHYLPLIDGEFGGNGELVDWALTQQLTEAGGAFILAGGLNSSNVQNAVRVPGTVGVDVSGGVETNGVKDTEKIKEFLGQLK